MNSSSCDYVCLRLSALPTSFQNFAARGFEQRDRVREIARSTGAGVIDRLLLAIRCRCALF